MLYDLYYQYLISKLHVYDLGRILDHSYDTNKSVIEICVLATLVDACSSEASRKISENHSMFKCSPEIIKYSTGKNYSIASSNNGLEV